jgi:hypothetical protein
LKKESGLFSCLTATYKKLSLDGGHPQILYLNYDIGNDYKNILQHSIIVKVFNFRPILDEKRLKLIAWPNVNKQAYCKQQKID